MILVRALDRFYKKLTAAIRSIPGLDSGTSILDVVLTVTQACVSSTCVQMELELRESLLTARQAIAAPRRLVSAGSEDVGGGGGAGGGSLELMDMVSGLQEQVVESMKSGLNRLKM